MDRTYLPILLLFGFVVMNAVGMLGLSHFTMHEDRCNSITLGTRSGGSDECDCGLADLEAKLKAVAL